MHKYYPRFSEFSGPQLTLKMSSNSPKGHQSPRSPQRSAKGIQDEHKVPKTLSTSSKSHGCQNILKRSSNGPNKVLKSFLSKELKRSTRSQQKVLKSYSMFWEHQVLRSLKSPQKIHKVLKNSRKCTNITQGSLSPQVLNWPSKCPQIRQKVIKALEVLRGPQKVFKTTTKSSKRSQRPQNPLVVKRSSKGHQMVVTKSSKVSYQKNSNVPQEVIKRSWKVLQCSESIRSSGLQKVRKRSTKSSRYQDHAQKDPNVRSPQVLKWSSNYSKGPQIPRIP